MPTTDMELNRVARDQAVTLLQFVDETEASELWLCVVNLAAPRPLQRMFADQPIDVQEIETEAKAGDMVFLLDDGTGIAQSPVVTVQEPIRMVNSDRYRSGSRDLDDGVLPDIIDGLDQGLRTVDAGKTRDLHPLKSERIASDR